MVTLLPEDSGVHTTLTAKGKRARPNARESRRERGERDEQLNGRQETLARAARDLGIVLDRERGGVGRDQPMGAVRIRRGNNQFAGD